METLSEADARAGSGRIAAAVRPGRSFRPTRTDLAFSTLVGALLAASPLTGATRLLPSLVLGALSAVATLVVRMRRPRRVSATGFTFARPSLATGAVLLAAAVAFAPTLEWLWHEYTESIWRNGQGLFVPFFMALLARSALRRDDSREPDASAWGFAFLVPALLLLVADAGIRSRYLSALGLALSLPGLSLLLLGRRRTRKLAFPLALGIFLVPVPTWFEHFIGLSPATAALVRAMLAPFDLPIAWHKTMLRMPGTIISISANCSGFSAFVAGLAFASMLAATSRSLPRAVLPFLLLYPTVVVTNALRCVALVMLAHHAGLAVVHTPLHGLSGIAVFVFVLLFLWLCADRAGLRKAIA